MSETSEMQIDVGRLSEAVRPAVEKFAERLGADLGEVLESLTVVGSALTDDFHPKYSDINTVLVVRRRSHALLQQIAGYGATLGKQKLRAPLLMTPEYLRSSLDVFGVELLDFQLNHATVIGPDPLAQLVFKKSDVRLQCERELKAALIQLRQGYVQTLGKPKLVGALLSAGVGSLLPLLRALLWLEGVDRPNRALATVTAAGDVFKIESAPLAKLIAHKQQHTTVPSEEVEALFENLYLAVDGLSRRVDEMQIQV